MAKWIGRAVLTACVMACVGAASRVIQRGRLYGAGSGPSPPTWTVDASPPVAESLPSSASPQGTALARVVGGELDGGEGTSSEGGFGKGHVKASPDSPVFLNSATEVDLRRLPGIGEKRAREILALRAKLGGFRAVEDLLRIRGLHARKLAKLRPLIRLGTFSPT